MFEHPINDLLNISMENIKSMVDANTIVGETVSINNVMIIPISKLKCSFATGGTDQFPSSTRENTKYPFGGATGGCVNITPVAFLVVVGDEVKLLHLEDQTHILEKVIDEIPDAFSSLKDLFVKKQSPKISNIEIIEKK